MKAARISPVAFKVSRNGRNVCTAGLRGKSGVISAILHWVDREGGDDLALEVGGLDSAAREHLTWAGVRLQIGDEVIVRVVETNKTTRLRSRKKMDQDSSEKREKLWLRKTAKKYGYKLVRS